MRQTHLRMCAGFGGNASQYIGTQCDIEQTCRLLPKPANAMCFYIYAGPEYEHDKTQRTIAQRSFNQQAAKCEAGAQQHTHEGYYPDGHSDYLTGALNCAIFGNSAGTHF